MITRFGGANSHMAIRCAELNIPALIGVGENNFMKISKSNFIEIDCQLKKFHLAWWYILFQPLRANIKSNMK